MNREPTGLIAREQHGKPQWYDASTGTLDRRIFSDPAIYRQELERIFARSWNFMCHESQITEPGQFFLNQIGDDRVIVVRDRSGAVQVLLNSCPHRGNTVCRAEEGKARSFFCTYHGWNFDLTGDLIGVPGYDPFYRGQLDRRAWGLARAAQVESYRGFVFATLDPAAPPLADFLGWVGRLGLDSMAARGDIEVVPGIQKNRLQCNWKLAVDNLFDWYHPKVSHGSAIRANVLTEESLFPMKQMVILGDYGHAIGGPGVTPEEYTNLVKRYDDATTSERQQAGSGVDDGSVAARLRTQTRPWRSTSEALAELGPVGVRSRGHPNIFPNVWIATGGTQMCLRLPRGPLETELWWFTFVEKSMSAEARRTAVQHAVHFFGPAGLLEQDDGENWSHSTRGSQGLVTGDRHLNFTMGMGQDEVREDASGQTSIETVTNEHAQRWTYQCWQDWMHADSWSTLQQNRHQPPTGVV